MLTSLPHPTQVAFNSDRYFETFFAASCANGIVVPINIRLAAPEIVDQFNDCEPEIVLIDDAFWDAVAPVIRAKCKSVKYIVYCGEKQQLPKGASAHYEKLIADTQPLKEAFARGGNDTFGIFYTGGTTGKAKGVELTHSNIFINALGHVGMLNYSTTSKYLHSAPMFHLADGASTFGVTMGAGTHVFIPRFVPDDVLDAIDKHRVNRAMMVPSMIAMMLQAPANAKRDLTCLENVMYGASPMPKAILEPALKMFPNAKFRQGYGMSESSPAITSLAPEYHDGGPRMGSVGQAVPWVEVRIVDEHDNEVPRGQPGEIVTRGPHVMKGYWKMKEKTAETLRGGWLHTEDGGIMDQDGFVYITDRIKDMIITGGENVYSSEVEAAVMAFPDIAQCAVVGFPDPKFVEIVTAVVVLKDVKKPFDETALLKHCKERIANYKVPRKVVVVKELPMSGAGKILKHKVRENLGVDRMGKTGLAKM